jgi:hypothetical protein
VPDDEAPEDDAPDEDSPLVPDDEAPDEETPLDASPLVPDDEAPEDDAPVVFSPDVPPEEAPEVSADAETGVVVPATVRNPDVTAAARAVRLLTFIPRFPLPVAVSTGCQGAPSGAGTDVEPPRAAGSGHPRQRGER